MPGVNSDATLCGHQGPIQDLAFSPDGAYLASAEGDFTVRIWDVDTAFTDPDRAELAVLRGHSHYVTSVAFSPDGQRLASASIDKTICLWDVRKSIEQASEAPAGKSYEASAGVVIDVLDRHGQGVESVAFDRSGTRLVSGGADRVIRIWDVNEGATISDLHKERNWPTPRHREINLLRGHAGRVHRVNVLPDGRIVSTGSEGSIKLWLPDVRDVPQLRGHRTSVHAVTLTPDDRFVLSGAYALFVWDADRCTPVARSFLRDQEYIRDLACWTDGVHTRAAAVTQPGENDVGGRVILWDLDDPTDPKRIGVFQPPGSRKPNFLSITVSSDGKRLAAGDSDGIIRVLDIESPAQMGVVAELGGAEEHTQPVNGVVFLDEFGRWLVSATGNRSSAKWDGTHTIHLWEVDSRREVEQHAEHDGPVMALALRKEHGDRRALLASASADKHVRLWSADWIGGVPSLKPAGVLKGHTEAVLSLAFHPVEPRLASGSDDRTIKTWDLDTKTEVATLRGRAGYALDLAYDSSGERLASTSAGFQGSDNVVRLWETGLSPETRRERAVAMRAYDEVLSVFQTAIPSINAARQKIEEDPAIPKDVRRVALKRFEDLLPLPKWLVKRAENVLADPNATEAAYRRALEWAEAAANMAPESEWIGDILTKVRDCLNDVAEPALDSVDQ